MKISRNWLQTYFEKPLPSAVELSHALTFHAFEIDGVERHQDDDILDVKVTPNRGHDCLSHRGIAKELAAILNVKLKNDPLRTPLPEMKGVVEMVIEDTERAPVGAAAYVQGVKIGPSPEWLKKRLEAVGQRSINNVVDATNYVMFDIGMPTHAFDATTFKDGNAIRYGIRTSKKGEQLALLGGVPIELTGQEAVIMNVAKEPVDIGGVKGGAFAELSDSTTELMLSASKFHPVHTRKAAQRFNQRTEAAKRFENEMADELALYGIHAVAALVRDVAGGEIVGYGIAKARTVSQEAVSVSLAKINAVLGTNVDGPQVADVFSRLDLPFQEKSGVFTVTPPFERLDIVIPEDLVEEVGRIVGYDKVAAVELPAFPNKPEINQNFAASERVREELVSKGYSEVYTSVFSDKGERAVSNKVGGEKPFLRTSLLESLTLPVIRNIHNKDLLGLKEVKLFEIGTVWKDGKESINIYSVVASGTEQHISGKQSVEMAIGEYAAKNLPQVSEKYEQLPISTTERYQPFSKYPFIVRDVALWTPAGTEPDAVLKIIRTHAGDLLVRSELFDRFEKAGKTSLAFRLVFQSFDRTLFDGDANERMESIYTAMREKEWEVR